MIDQLERYYQSEYHRRNIQVARVCGAQAAVDQALERALKVKSIPVWLIALLESAASRLPGLQHDLAAWRDLAHDEPAPATEYIRAAAIREAALREAIQSLREWQDDLNRHKMTETALTVGMAADAVFALIQTKGAADDQ